MSLLLNLRVLTSRRSCDDRRPRDDWSDDQPFELLANARRRECVQCLANRPEAEDVPVRELADSVADSLARDESAPQRLRQSVYTSVTQYHLDKLNGHRVVDYDPETQSVSTGSNFEAVARATRVSASKRRPFTTVSLWTSTLTFAALLVTATVYSQSPTLAVLGVAVLNLLPVGLFVQMHVVERRSRS